MKKSNIYGFIFIGSIVGYPLVAGISSASGLSNNLMSLLLRVAIAAWSFYIILDGLFLAKKMMQKIMLLTALIFCVGYVIRLYFDLFIFNHELSKNHEYYWIWFIGGCFLPFLALAIGVRKELDWSKIFNNFYCVSIVAGVLVMLNANSFVGGDFGGYDSGRLRLDVLNPISLGHLGGTIFLIATWRLFFSGEFKASSRLIFYFGVVLGLYLLIASNSRGPIVAVFFGVLVAFFATKLKGKIFILMSIILFSLVVPNIMIYMEEGLGITVYSRFFGQSFFQETTVVERSGFYAVAASSIFENIIFGAGVEGGNLESYPHNVIIEAFLSVGIFFGTVFLILLSLGLVVCFRVSKNYPQLLWVGMLCMQYIVAAQFSGAIYASPNFWAALGVLTFLSRNLISQKTFRPLNERSKAL